MTYPIEWSEKKHKGVTMNTDAVIGKGPAEKVTSFINFDKKETRESTIPIRITDEDLGTCVWDTPAIKIGKSHYNSRFIYQAIEEMTGKDILLSTGRKAKRKMAGEMLWLDVIIADEELVPIIFKKDNETAYAIAPRTEPEEEEHGVIK